MRRPRSSSSRVLRLIAALAPVCSAGLAHGQDGAPPAALFASDEPLRLRLEAPFGDILRDRTDPEYERGRLVYTDASGTERVIDLRLRVRGRSRAANCAFPPLLLNFPAEGLGGTTFEGQNRLKLVTHCESSEAYEQYLRLEYLIYPTLSLLTDMSLAVRLVEVTYYDSERQREVASKPGFLIEDEERFAARHGFTIVPDERVDRARYDRRSLALVEMFEYFIGNTDWSAVAGPAGEACCHNIVPYARGDDQLVPVPYDFDSSGLVNTPRAEPAASLPIRDVRQRLYRGPCRDLAEIEASFEPLVRHRARITALFADDPVLTREHVERVVGYFDDFYELLDDPQRVERVFRAGCEN
jgi:hypothetical protein